MGTKMKLQARLTEASGTLEQMNAKLGQVEKAKLKLQAEIDSMNAQTDQAHILNSSMEKKAKQFDKIVGEWKLKVDGLGMDLQAALEEAEGSLEQEENKVLRAQVELTQVRAEIERRIGEKEEEFQSTKKNFTKAVDGMQGALEQESKGKAEAIRMKKKLESDVTE